jgi:intracellular sulfur oxidation DsrE/DsrF family protein
MKKLTLLALTLCTLLCLAPAAAPAFAQSPPTAPAKIHRVIFAVTSGDEADWSLTLGNARNLIAGLKPAPYEIEIVSFGPGINLIKADSPVAKDIAALQADGVKFTACQNAMRFHHLELKDLVPGAIPVPAGIVELVTKQEQGWIYVKGGR